MRLLMLNNEYPPIGGGTATANYYVIRELARRGINVDLVTSNPSSNQFAVEELSPHSHVYRIPIHNKNPHYQSERELMTYITRAFGFIRTLYQGNQPKYDLCHAWSGLPAGALALLLRWKRQLPYIVSLRGSDVPGYDPRYKHLYPVLKPALHAIWGFSSAITANSYELRSLALNFRPKETISVIPNGVDLAQFTPAILCDKRLAEPINILCVARLVERKGIGDLLSAIPLIRERFNNFKIILVGRGDKEGEYRARVQAEGLDQWVTFRGAVLHKDMPAIYQQADMFILPSLNEGMSNAALEAMAAGLPIVTTYTGGTAEILRGNGILVPKQSPDAIAKALLELLEDFSLRQTMGQRSRHIAETMIWERVVDQHLDLYERTLQSVRRLYVPRPIML